jgi:hypothetical protein
LRSIDLATFGMEIVLNRRLIPGYVRKFEFVEREPGAPEEEPALQQFLRHLSGTAGATEEEIEFLRRLRFDGKHPTPLYYYRELQNLRDPLHFTERAVAAMQKRRHPDDDVKNRCNLIREKAQSSGRQETRSLPTRKTSLDSLSVLPHWEKRGPTLNFRCA